MSTQSQFSFGKANDRWHFPTQHKELPEPATYYPKENLNDKFNSKAKRTL